MARMAANASVPDRFEGFPAGAFDFYDALADNNTRPWWNDHKADYERAVKAPLESLLVELAAEFGTAKLFRPYNDTRFAKDKPPIKEHQGGVVELEDAVAYYVQVSAGGLMVAGGWYAPLGQQVHRFREAVDGPRGAELERLVAAARRRFEIDGRPLKTKPKGYEVDNPRIELLRFRALTVARTYPPSADLGTRKALTNVRNDWRAMRPLLEWLADNVGPGSDPADGT
jgi:uncharacterized protein (TIGR02453 family)